MAIFKKDHISSWPVTTLFQQWPLYKDCMCLLFKPSSHCCVPWYEMQWGSVSKAEESQKKEKCLPRFESLLLSSFTASIHPIDWMYCRGARCHLLKNVTELEMGSQTSCYTHTELSPRHVEWEERLCWRLRKAEPCWRGFFSIVLYIHIYGSVPQPVALQQL